MEGALHFLQNYKGAGGKSRGPNLHNPNKLKSKGVDVPQLGKQGGNIEEETFRHTYCTPVETRGITPRHVQNFSAEECRQLGVNHVNISENVKMQDAWREWQTLTYGMTRTTKALLMIPGGSKEKASLR